MNELDRKLSEARNKPRLRVGRHGNPRPQWGHHPNHDIDRLMHWMIDGQRCIERLRVVNEGLHVVARLVESGAPASESSEILDGVIVLAGEVRSKADTIYSGMRSHRKRKAQ